MSILQGLARQCQFTLEVLPALNLDDVNLDDWKDCIDEDVAAIFALMLTSVHGYRYLIETIGRIPRPEECLFIVDAAQALGQTPGDIEQLGCDALVSTCQKRSVCKQDWLQMALL